MKRKCDTCEYGPYSAMSDRCDECREDPDTGWGGFTDCSVTLNNGSSPHFYSEKERDKFYEENDL